MAHHGDDTGAFKTMREEMLRRLANAGSPAEMEQLLGPTGQFPEGKLNENDEGEIRIAVGHQNGKVVIDFGKPIAWIGFSAGQARELAGAIIQHAEQVEKGL